MDLNELTFDNIGIWPWPAKIAVVALSCVIILTLGYWFAVKPQVKQLKMVELEEVDLRSTFEIKSSQASNLAIYKEQVQEVKKRLNTMLLQLPEQTEVPNLIEDISKVGIASGLEFNLIKPEPEKKLDFYAELPIEIVVSGNYHEFAEDSNKVEDLQKPHHADKCEACAAGVCINGGQGRRVKHYY